MMRLLAYTSPARGHLYPLIPILLELRRRGHETAVLTLASGVDTTRALGIEASAISERVERFVPHDAVLKRVACVVCHGGMGITQKALAAGVPVVVVPFGRDQLETARRVEYADAGVRLPPRRLTPERLADAVREAITCRPQAERVSRLFARAGGVVAAADAIEALASKQSASHVAASEPNEL